jgi:hypothetical protein
MKELFKNKDTNIAAAPLFKEISDILEALELCDIMMPSNPSHEKDNVEQSKKDLFYEMANNTLEFSEFKLSLFELDLKEIKKWVHRDEMQIFYQLSDIIAITLCKVLGFELGRISYYIKNGDRSNDSELTSHKSSILKLKGLVTRMLHLETTKVPEIELKKFQRQIFEFDSKLNNRSFFKRLVGIFK